MTNSDGWAAQAQCDGLILLTIDINAIYSCTCLRDRAHAGDKIKTVWFESKIIRIRLSKMN